MQMQMQSQTELQDFDQKPVSFEAFQNFQSKTEHPRTSNQNQNERNSSSLNPMRKLRNKSSQILLPILEKNNQFNKQQKSSVHLDNRAKSNVTQCESSQEKQDSNQDLKTIIENKQYQKVQKVNSNQSFEASFTVSIDKQQLKTNYFSKLSQIIKTYNLLISNIINQMKILVTYDEDQFFQENQNPMFGMFSIINFINLGNTLMCMLFYVLPQIQGLKWTQQLFYANFAQFFYLFGWIVFCIYANTNQKSPIDQFIFQLITVLGFPVFLIYFLIKSLFYSFDNFHFQSNWVEQWVFYCEAFEILCTLILFVYLKQKNSNSQTTISPFHIVFQKLQKLKKQRPQIIKMIIGNLHMAEQDFCEIQPTVSVLTEQESSLGKIQNLCTICYGSLFINYPETSMIKPQVIKCWCIFEDWKYGKYREKFEQNSRILMLECKHAFHDKCLMKWKQQNSACPLCRVKF